MNDAALSMTHMRLRPPTLLLALVLAAPGAWAAAAQPPQAPALVVTGATPAPDGQTLTIAGANFGGGRPLVTLDLVPVGVHYATDSEIVAAVPIALMPSGTYLLTVSRGPSAAENGWFQVRIGTGNPAPGGAASSDLVSAALSTSGAEPAAKVGDRIFTVADVDEEWRRRDPGVYLGLARDIYDNRRRVVDSLVMSELLAREAAARGISTQALLEQEIPRHTVPAPESAVLALYQSLGDRTRGAGLEQMRPALRAWLQQMTEPELAKMVYVEELMKVSTRADVLLAPPRVRVERTAQDVVLGSPTAAVEIVAFGDLQNLEYARLAQVFGKVRETFGAKVRFVFKHLPAVGPESYDAAEAAACANAQGRFWEYHDVLVGQPGRLSPDHLKRIAAEAGLDRRTFDACVGARTFNELIRQAALEARRYGVTASPRFLVNGWLAPAPPPFLPPFEYFKRVIEEELLRVSRAASSAR